MNALRDQLIFPSKPNFCNLFEFPVPNQYLSHFSSENCEINYIKSDPPRAFQQLHERPQFPIQFSVSILLNFHWENDSIINRFHITAPNSLKPSLCTLTDPELSEGTKSRPWRAIWFWRSQPGETKQNKTNYLAS